MTGLQFNINPESKEGLTAYEKRMLMFSLIRTICAILALAVVFAVFYSVSDAMVKINGIMDSVSVVAGQLEDADVENMLKEIRTLVSGAEQTLDTTAQGMEQAINKMQSIDIEALNAAIRDLAAVVEPLARFFGR